MEITECLDKIINAKKGREVRQALHDGLKHCYSDATGNPESQSALVQDVIDLQNESAATAENVAGLKTEVYDCVTQEEIDQIFA